MLQKPKNLEVVLMLMTNLGNCGNVIMCEERTSKERRDETRQVVGALSDFKVIRGAQTGQSQNLASQQEFL